MSDDAMDRPFPPGPRGPEEVNVPGPKVTVMPAQARAVKELSDRCSYVTVEDRGQSYLEVEMFGPEGEQLGKRRVYPDGFYGTENLPGSAEKSDREPPSL